MIIKMIAAIGENRERGKKNGLIWNLSGDMKFFRETTRGANVVMGENTFRSLPKMLPGRKHFVLTLGNAEFPDEVEVSHSLDEFIAEHKNSDETFWVIGGGQIYKLFLSLASEIYLTEIDASDDSAEVYFPEFDKQNYSREVVGSGEDDGVKYSFVKYIKK
jgi:dihydrofolate reductase